MEKIVYTVFKTIMLSMIFVLIWQLVFYLLNVTILNQRMTNIMVTLERTVSQNNFLPPEEATLFEAMLDAEVANFNGFIDDWMWNYGQANEYIDGTICVANSGSGYDMSVVNNYGGVANICILVQVNSPWVGWGSPGAREYDGTAADWHVDTIQLVLKYNAYVPCLKYRKLV